VFTGSLNLPGQKPAPVAGVFVLPPGGEAGQGIGHCLLPQADAPPLSARFDLLAPD
jgi:hypothetical protein